MLLAQLLQCSVLIFGLTCFCSARYRRRSLPRECFTSTTSQARSIMSLFDRLVSEGPSYEIMSELTKLFEKRYETDHLSNNHNNHTESCVKKAFLSINDNFVSLDATIRLLQAEDNLKKSLIDTRQTTNNVHKVYYGLDLYERQKEGASLRDAAKQCELYHPRNSLIELRSHVMSAPKLFEEILSGVGYSQVEFERISEVWLKEAGLCMLLMQACEKLEYSNASVALQDLRQSLAINMLKDIYEMLLEARKKLKVDFKNVVRDDISRMLREIEARDQRRPQAVVTIHNYLSSKFSFREWAVIMHNRMEATETSKHSHEGSTDDWFLVNDAHHTVIAHSADKELNCSFFGDNFHNRTLRDFFPNNAAFAAFVNSDHNGHLGNAISTLKEIFQDRNLPEYYFFSVILYDSSIVVKRGSRFHYFENIRLSKDEHPTKSILIGWC